MVVFVENVSEPVVNWLPSVLLFVFTSPLLIIIPEKGVLVLVPLEVTPVKLTAATVLLLMFEIVPSDIPLKTMPWNFPVEPVSVYVPVWVFDA